MIEVMALAGAVKGVSAAISGAIKAGKDISSLAGPLAKLGDLDAQIQIAESGKHKGLLGKLSTSESEAFAIVAAKQAHKDAMDNLRQLMQLFGGPGQWESFQAELGRIRKKRAEALKEQARKKRQFELIVVSIVAVVMFIGGTIAMVYFAWRFGT
jgi:hypothetical protein